MLRLASSLLGILISSTALAGGPAKPDYNARGFNEYKKGNHQKALALFARARTETPENAYGWFNWARVTAQLNAKVEPDDCDRATDWRYLAVASLDEGVRRDREKVVEKIREEEPGLVPLENTAVFKRWWVAVQPMPRTDAELKAFLEAHPTWFHYDGVVQVTTELAPDGRVLETRAMGEAAEQEVGRWTVRNGALQLTRGTEKPLVVKLVQQPWCFAQGKHCFAAIRLVDESYDINWDLGAPEDDCGAQ